MKFLISCIFCQKLKFNICRWVEFLFILGGLFSDIPELIIFFLNNTNNSLGQFLSKLYSISTYRGYSSDRHLSSPKSVAWARGCLMRLNSPKNSYTAKSVAWARGCIMRLNSPKNSYTAKSRLCHPIISNGMSKFVLDQKLWYF